MEDVRAFPPFFLSSGGAGVVVVVLPPPFGAKGRFPPPTVGRSFGVNSGIWKLSSLLLSKLGAVIRIQDLLFSSVLLGRLLFFLSFALLTKRHSPAPSPPFFTYSPKSASAQPQPFFLASKKDGVDRPSFLLAAIRTMPLPLSFPFRVSSDCSGFEGPVFSFQEMPVTALIFLFPPLRGFFPIPGDVPPPPSQLR